MERKERENSKEMAPRRMRQTHRIITCRNVAIQSGYSPKLHPPIYVVIRQYVLRFAADGTPIALRRRDNTTSPNREITMRRSTFRTTVALATAASIAACSDAGGPSAGGQVNFNLATRPAGAPTAAVHAASFATLGTPETFTDGTNTLVIDRVQLVLREIELKRAEATVNCGEDAGHDACEKLELGPVLLDLPLGGAGGAARSFSVPVDAGTYDEVEFEIHKPSHDEDAAFVQANPDFDGVSVKVDRHLQRRAGSPIRPTSTPRKRSSSPRRWPSPARRPPTSRCSWTSTAGSATERAAWSIR